MGWLVGPLVTTGFRVVALDHHGNNSIDGYEPEGFLFGWERPRDISFTLDALAKEETLGPIGAAGFSFGGYAVAALAGARVDPQKVAAVLAGTIPLPEIPEFPGVLAALQKKVTQDELLIHIDRSGADLTDNRIRAVFQVAPGWGPFVTPSSLASIQVPVEIIWGGADTIAPFHEINSYLKGIPTATGRSAGPHIRHEDFIDSAATTTKARDHVAQEAAAFFARHLGQPLPG
jgi:predicted dienelactone hydrolase